MTISTMRPEPVARSAAIDGTGIPEQILFGRCEAMQAIRAKLERVAQTNIPVLIIGESGTGKEVIARYVHSRSRWHSGQFVRINCPGIPGALLESELFGYEKGAFTGASVAKRGLVESASDGTLFLDGIGELEFSLQSKFLQFLQDGQFARIGGQENLHANARIICAASRPLETEIESGHFRRDLLYRINVVTVNLPPLRERRLDISELIDFFLHRFSKEFGRPLRPIRAATRDLLVANDWPGNIRQIENVIKRYVILDSEDAILAEIYGRAPLALNASAGEAQQVSLKQVTRSATRELERKVILDSLSTHRWNRKRTAQALRISYRALLYKMKQGGLLSKRTELTAPTENGR
jgi:two-component system response regulator AtoC